MSIREKISSILFGSKEEPPVQEEGGGSLQPEPQEEAAPESSPFPAEEQDAICVTKGQDELLDAINAVLSELGEDGINSLVVGDMGLE